MGSAWCIEYSIIERCRVEDTASNGPWCGPWNALFKVSGWQTSAETQVSKGELPYISVSLPASRPTATTLRFSLNSARMQHSASLPLPPTTTTGPSMPAAERLCRKCLDENYCRVKAYQEGTSGQCQMCVCPGRVKEDMHVRYNVISTTA